jgi:hypothetical protein
MSNFPKTGAQTLAVPSFVAKGVKYHLDLDHSVSVANLRLPLGLRECESCMGHGWSLVSFFETFFRG